MDLYDGLNFALYDFFADPYFEDYVHYLDEIAKLARIIVENTPIFSLKEYSERVPINDSIQNVVDFFNSVDPQYAYRFQNILREQNEYNGRMDYSVRFYRMLDEGQPLEYEGQHNDNVSQVESSGFVHIDYNDTLEDSFAISHEITHKFSQPRDQDSTIKQFIEESSPITMEFLLEDYFLQTGKYPKEEIIKEKNNRLLLTYNNAVTILFESELLRLYRENNNYISQEVLINYLDGLDRSSKLCELFAIGGEAHINLLSSCGIQFPYECQYVIGTVLASFFHNKILSNPANIQLLCYLIDILGHTDLSFEEDMQLLSKLGIPIIKDGKVQVTD